MQRFTRQRMVPTHLQEAQERSCTCLFVVVIIIVVIVALVHIDALTQLLTHFEVRNTLLRNVNDLAGLGVTTFACIAALDREASEATDLDALASDEGSPHAFEDGINNDLNIFLGDIAILLRNFFQPDRSSSPLAPYLEATQQACNKQTCSPGGFGCR